ncbi:hypothetical protein DUNSADRAFT_13728, partial [Dunaliella salina]
LGTLPAAADVFGHRFPDLLPTPPPPGQSNLSAPAVLTHQHLFHMQQLEQQQQQQQQQKRTAMSAQIPRLDAHHHHHLHQHPEHEFEPGQQCSPQHLMLTPPALSTQELPEYPGSSLELQSRESPQFLPALPENVPLDLGKEQQEEQQQQQQQQQRQLAPDELTRQLILQHLHSQHQPSQQHRDQQQQQQQHQLRQAEEQQTQQRVQEQQQEEQQGQLHEVEQQQEQKLRELLPPGISPGTWNQPEALPSQQQQQQQQQWAYDQHQLQPVSLGFPEPMSISEYTSERPSPEDMVVVCSVCEEQWPTWRLEEHSELCAVLRQLSSSGLSVDGMLTTLANVIEEQVRMIVRLPCLIGGPETWMMAMHTPMK